jgi:hypothetical protein
MAEVYFYMKKIKMSLIAMDIAPYYPDADWVHKPELVNDYDFSIPKVKRTTDVHPYLQVEPVKVDFRKPVSILWYTYRLERGPYSIDELGAQRGAAHPLHDGHEQRGLRYAPAADPSQRRQIHLL